MRRPILPILLLPLLLVLNAAAPAARPQRIVSLNLCADQLLIALADPGQIAALTRLARDPAMSAAAGPARRFRTIGGSAEEVVALAPDLVIAAPGRRATLHWLAGRGAQVIELPPADRYADIVAQVRQVAAAVGHAARGEALVAAMDARLARVPRPGAGRVAAQYQRRGYLTGTGTLVDELMARVGLVNLAARLGKPVLARIGLEELVLARPDYLLVEDDRVVDQGTELLQHPLIAGIPRLRLSEAWTTCGGPAYVLAAEQLAAQLRPLPATGAGPRPAR